MNKYIVNFKRLALLLLPGGLRKPAISALAMSIMTPLSRLHREFMEFRESTIYRLTHNGQVCHLEAVLNDMFDPIGRRITVDDPGDGERNDIMFHMREQNRSVIFYLRGPDRATTFNRRGFGGVNGFDFYVSVPSNLAGSIDTDRMRTLINTYKLASRRYSIIFNEKNNR